GAENAHGHRQVEAGAFFLQVGGSKIDDNLGGRNIVAAILQRGEDSLATFAHCRIRQADGHEVVFFAQHAAGIDFYIDEVGVNSINSSAESAEEHRRRSITSGVNTEVTKAQIRSRCECEALALRVLGLNLGALRVNPGEQGSPTASPQGKLVRDKRVRPRLAANSGLPLDIM